MELLPKEQTINSAMIFGMVNFVSQLGEAMVPRCLVKHYSSDEHAIVVYRSGNIMLYT